jgi:hypothetical protein
VPKAPSRAPPKGAYAFSRSARKVWALASTPGSPAR